MNEDLMNRIISQVRMRFVLHREQTRRGAYQAVATSLARTPHGRAPRQGRRMIELCTWSTPNGQKASIMLEEVGLPYRLHPIDIGNDYQRTISPTCSRPAIRRTSTWLVVPWRRSRRMWRSSSRKIARQLPPIAPAAGRRTEKEEKGRQG